MKKSLSILVLSTAIGFNVFAGNPDRRGEAGAFELVMNGWARSAGVFGMNSASIKGVEAERFNPGGLAAVKKTEVSVAYSLWLQGSGVGVIHAGVAQNFKETNVISLSINALNLGSIERTTVNNPEGNLGSYKPNFINIGITYAKVFSNSIYGGITMRMINQSIENLNATGFAVDAGLQYVTGPKDNVHFGVAIRNVGTPIRYRGDGLGRSVSFTNGDSYQLTLDSRGSKFELPTQLNIGASYDAWIGKKKEIATNKFRQDYRITSSAQFTSNAFGSDNFGLGLEFGWREMLMLRAGYRFEAGIFKKATTPSVYTGLAAGLTVDVPFKKDGTGPKMGLDYAFRATRTYMGTHSIGLRFTL